MCLPSLKLGMPKRSKPPGNSSFSNTVTSYPFPVQLVRHGQSGGTATDHGFTFFLLRTGWIGLYVSFPGKRLSTIAASFSTDRDRFVAAKFQYAAFLAEGGQTRPVNSGKSSVCSNT